MYTRGLIWIISGKKEHIIAVVAAMNHRSAGLVPVASRYATGVWKRIYGVLPAAVSTGSVLIAGR
jgi:hypothetical protein